MLLSQTWMTCASSFESAQLEAFLPEPETHVLGANVLFMMPAAASSVDMGTVVAASLDVVWADGDVVKPSLSDVLDSPT